MLYSAFLHLDRNKNGAKRNDKTFHFARLSFFIPQKDEGKKAQPLFWNKTAARSSSDDWLQTCEWGDYSSETNSTERLKGRRFGPTGISSCYSPFAVSRPFIHWNVCTSHRLQQETHPFSEPLQLHVWGKTNEKAETGRGRNKKRKQEIQLARLCSERCALFIIRVTSLENISCFSFTGVCSSFFFFFFSCFPSPEESLTKSLKGEQNCFVWFLIKGVFEEKEESHHPLGDMNSGVVKFRLKCRHKNTPYHKKTPKKQDDRGADACPLWLKSEVSFPLFHPLVRTCFILSQMSHYPGPKLLNWIVCYTEQGHLSLWKDHKCLFLYEAREITFSQGRETGWGHPARIHPPQPSSHEDLNILLFLPASAPVFT